jgi:tetratricopeptide (TPR) repeat protein
MDPIAIIVSALIEGAIVAAKDVTSQAVKDGYKDLVSLIRNRFGKREEVAQALTEIEERPTSEDNQDLLTRELKSAGASKDSEVLKQARALLELLTSNMPGSVPNPKPYHNLPNTDFGVFIDREKELDQIHRILRPYPDSQHAFITIGGVGGVGKSALALEVAHRYLRDYARLPEKERFEAIIWFSAKLTVLTATGIATQRQNPSTLDDLFTTIAIALGREDITRARIAEQTDLVSKALTQQRTLLIIDNLETIDDERVYAFLREIPAPTKTILTTRHKIDVAYPIQLIGMTWEATKELIEQECLKKNVTLEAEESRQLFERTGGVPLAIVWSIAQLSLGYGLQAVLARLDQPTDDIARYCFEKAYEFVREGDSYRILLTLAVLSGATTRTMLGEIAEFGEDIIRRDQALAELERLSLVNRQGNLWGVLPLVKQYTLALCGQEERDKYLLNAAKCFSDYVLKNVSDERFKSARRFGYDALEAERLNIFGLIDWCYENRLWDLVIQLVLGIGYFPHARGYWRDAIKYWEFGANAGQLTDNQAAYARCTTYLGYMYFFQSDYKAAEKYARRASLAIDHSIASYQLASIFRLQSHLAKSRGDNLEATQYLEDGLAMMRKVKSLSGTSKILNDLGELAYTSGKYAAAEQYLNESLAISETIDDWTENTRGLRHLGELARLTGKFDEARTRFQESLTSAKEIGWYDEVGYITLGLSKLESQCKNVQQAIDLANEALGIFERLGQNIMADETRKLIVSLQGAHPQH